MNMQPASGIPHEDVKYLQQLLALGQTLNSSLKLEEVLNVAIDSVVKFVGAERGFIMLFNEQGELELKACKNVDKELIRRMEGISKTIINISAWQGKSIVSVNAQSDPRFKESESVMLTGMRSVISVPLKLKKQIIGLIYLDNRVEEGMFNDMHLSMLEAFSNQAAGAIENARLHSSLIRSFDERLRLGGELHQQERKRLASEEANRLKSDFVNIVSHELRSPLTVIKNYAATLHRDLSTNRNAIDDEMKLDIYTTIDCEVDRLLSLINKLLDVSRIDAGKKMMLDIKPIEISSIVDNVIKLLSTSKFYKKNLHTIRKVVPNDLPRLECDKAKITQVLLNIVENSLKYSPDGGEVTISASSKEDYMDLVVADQGLGMSEEDKAKLFQKYERFDNVGRSIPGTGLGLYLVKHLIDLHSGAIRVESKLGIGSAFFFRLPLIHPKEKTSDK